MIVMDPEQDGPMRKALYTIISITALCFLAAYLGPALITVSASLLYEQGLVSTPPANAVPASSPASSAGLIQQLKSLFSSTASRSYSAEDTSVLLAYSPEVRHALSHGLPVVALESTIISHGMPYPQNVVTAREVEAVVRKAGAVPATIAILSGVLHVGLNDEELEYLGKKGTEVSKVSRRDLAAVLAVMGDGATTVAATSYIASLAGIKVFVTGGIGGVHRGVEETMDISADLTELGRTPICVVSAGVKSLLDIGRTLEYLETEGVTVIGFGTDEFPAFFTRKSGFTSPLRLDSPEEVAKVVDANQRLALKSGVLVAVPIPVEEEANGRVIEDAIQHALREAKEGQIIGRDVTPFILKRVNELTGGNSLKSNIALVKNNAKIGSAIAVALSHPFKATQVDETTQEQKPKSPVAPKVTNPIEYPVVVVGGTLVDVVAKVYTAPLLPRTSNMGAINMQVGGVGRNIAEVLKKLEAEPFFISVVADDPFGTIALSHLKSVGVATAGVKIVESREQECKGDECASVPARVGTAMFSAVMDNTGEQNLAVADVSIFQHITPAFLASFESVISKSKMVVFDANIPVSAMVALCKIAKKYSKPVWFEPTCVPNSPLPIRAGLAKQIDYISPNRDELIAMATAAGHPGPANTEEPSTEEIKSMATTLIDAGIKHALVKLGADGGVLVEAPAEVGGVPSFTFFKPPKTCGIVNVAGAGDSLVGAMIWGITTANMTMQQCLPHALQSVRLSLESRHPISPLLTKDALMKTE